MLRTIVETVQNAAPAIVGDEAVRIGADSILKAGSAAEKPVFRIELRSAEKSQRILRRRQGGQQEFRVAGAEPVVPCAPGPDDGVPVLAVFLVDPQLAVAPGEGGEQCVPGDFRRDYRSRVPAVEGGVAGPRRGILQPRPDDRHLALQQPGPVEADVACKIAAGD